MEKIVETIVTAAQVTLQIMAFLVVLGAVLTFLIIAREVSWYVRESNRRKLEQQQEDKEE